MILYFNSACIVATHYSITQASKNSKEARASEGKVSYNICTAFIVGVEKDAEANMCKDGICVFSVSTKV
jgi:hypothetical protein